MKFRTLLKGIFILCVGMFIADALSGIILQHEWKKEEGTTVQDPHKLFGHIEEYKDKPGDIEPIAFQTIGGRKLSLDQLKGKYVLLNAWATWCAPCVKELPALQNMKSKLDKMNWTVIAASVDFNVNLQEIFEFVKEHNAEGVANYIDTSGLLQDMVMKVGGIPVTYILSPEGKIIARINGSVQWDSDDIVAFLNGIPKK